MGQSTEEHMGAQGYRSPSDLRRDAYYKLAQDHMSTVRVWCPVMGETCVGRSCVAARIREASLTDRMREHPLLAYWECSAYPGAGRRVDAVLEKTELD